MPLYDFEGSRPTLPADGSAWLAPSADVIGDVRLGEAASVWFGAVIRADNTPIVIGARSNVQDGATLHSDPGQPLTIGDDVTIGHRAIVHGCIIGDGTLVGMGAIILNGAVLEAECLVGAGAVVTERQHFPARSLIVGCPAKAIRILDDAAASGLKKSAASYVRKAQRFRSGLR